MIWVPLERTAGYKLVKDIIQEASRKNRFHISQIEKLVILEKKTFSIIGFIHSDIFMIVKEIKSLILTHTKNQECKFAYRNRKKHSLCKLQSFFLRVTQQSRSCSALQRPEDQEPNLMLCWAELRTGHLAVAKALSSPPFLEQQQPKSLL